jgi:hypothetical protein
MPRIQFVVGSNLFSILEAFLSHWHWLREEVGKGKPL